MPSNPQGRPAYVIGTEHLVLRCAEPTDASAFLAAVAKNKHRLRMWADPAPFDTLPSLLGWLRRARGWFDLEQAYCFSILLRGESEPMGFAELDPRHPLGGFEISGWIDVDQSNKGYAGESAAALAKLAFELYGARRVEMYCDPDNRPMQRMSERMGFRHEATLRRRVPTDGGARDRMLWTIHDCDYRGTPASAVEVIAFDALGRVVFATDPAPRPPPASPWGRDALTWHEAKEHLGGRYPSSDVRESSFAVTLRFPLAGGLIDQRVTVALGDILEQPLVVVSAEVAPEAHLGARDALAHNATLAVGALCIVNDAYVLRQSMALAGLTGAQLDRFVTLVGHEAARLRAQTQHGETDAQLSAWWADDADIARKPK
jgi:RimJ/RimL family protein N-acetyltransferase